METIKLARMRDRQTNTTYSLQAITDYVVEMSIRKGDSKDYVEFSFQLKTHDMQSLAKHMTEFAQEMELERNLSLRR
jgi:hypothetical protein